MASRFPWSLGNTCQNSKKRETENSTFTIWSWFFVTLLSYQITFVRKKQDISPQGFFLAKLKMEIYSSPTIVL